jgi:hypothetical protein
VAAAAVSDSIDQVAAQVHFGGVFARKITPCWSGSWACS